MISKLMTGGALACVTLGTGITAWAVAGGGPVNDSPCDAILVEAGVPLDFDNTGASADQDEVSPGVGTDNSCNAIDGWCESDPDVQASVWFTFEATGAAFTQFAAFPTDYQLAIWTADDCINYETFAEVAANDDSGPGFSPRLTLAGLEPGTYYIQIDGWDGEMGAGTLLIEEFNPPDNDDACNATWLDLDSVNDFTNELAGAQDGEVSPGAGNDGEDGCNATDGWCNFETEVQSSVWFMFEAPHCGVVNIGVTSEVGQQDYQLAVWHVGDCGDFSTYQEVAANDDSGPGFSPALSDLELLPYELYYIQVDGFNGFDAPGQISISTNTTGGSDCNGNGITDNCDIGEIDLDCNCNGVPDHCDLVANPMLDLYPRNGIIDECEDCVIDANCDGVIDFDDMWINLRLLQQNGTIPLTIRHPDNIIWWNWVWNTLTGCGDVVMPF